MPHVLMRVRCRIARGIGCIGAYRFGVPTENPNTQCCGAMSDLKIPTPRSGKSQPLCDDPAQLGKINVFQLSVRRHRIYLIARC
jgi:hypothetical protein